MDKAHDVINRLEADKTSLKKNILDSHGKLELKLSVQTLTEKLKSSKENEINISIEVVKLQSTISRLTREIEDSKASNNNNNNNININDNSNNILSDIKKSSKQELINSKNMDNMKNELSNARSEIQKLKTTSNNEKNRNFSDLKRIYNKAQIYSSEIKKIEKICAEFETEIFDSENEDIQKYENNWEINDNKTRLDEMEKIKLLQEQIIQKENHFPGFPSAALKITNLNDETILSKLHETKPNLPGREITFTDTPHTSGNSTIKKSGTISNLAENIVSMKKYNDNLNDEANDDIIRNNTSNNNKNINNNVNDKKPFLTENNHHITEFSHTDVDNILGRDYNKLIELNEILITYKLRNEKQKQENSILVGNLISKISAQEENEKKSQIQLTIAADKLIEIEELNKNLNKEIIEKEKEINDHNDNNKKNSSNNNNNNNNNDDDSNNSNDSNNNNNNHHHYDNKNTNEDINEKNNDYTTVNEVPPKIDDLMSSKNRIIMAALQTDKINLENKISTIEEQFQKERYENSVDRDMLLAELETAKVKERRNEFLRAKSKKHEKNENLMIVRESKRMKEIYDFSIRYDLLQENYYKTKTSLLSAESKIIEGVRENEAMRLKIMRAKEKEEEKVKEKGSEEVNEKNREKEKEKEKEMIEDERGVRTYDDEIEKELEINRSSVTSIEMKSIDSSIQISHDKDKDDYDYDSNYSRNPDIYNCKISSKNSSSDDSKRRIEELENRIVDEKVIFKERIKKLLKAVGMYDGTHIKQTLILEQSDDKLYEIVSNQIDNQRMKILLLKNCLQRLKCKLTPKEIEDFTELGIILTSKIRKNKPAVLNFGSALCFA